MRKLSKVKTPKSNHKHVYKECLIDEAGFHFLQLGKYCAICGKIRVTNFMITRNDNSHYTLLTNEEILEEYSELPLKHLP